MHRRWPFGAAVVALCALVCLLASASDPPATTKKARSGLPHRAAVDAYVLGPTQLVAGSTATYRVAVHWAASPKRSGPLPGATVALSLRAGKRTYALVTAPSDQLGNADVRFVVPRVKTGRHKLRVRIDSSLGRSSRESDVRIFPGGRLLLTTDKKLYQPTQAIHIRALALRSIDLKPVANRPVRIEVADPKGTIVFSSRGRTSRFGVTSVDFQLADEINLGHYSISAWTDGGGQTARSSKSVEVKRYVLPKFKVAVETERAYYRPGETVRGTVRSRYFFGKPIVGGKVTLDIRARMGAVVRFGMPERRTDKEGRATFEVKLERTRGEQMGEVRVLAKVVDTAGHREQGDLSVPLTATPLQLSLVTENDQLVRGVRNEVHVVAGYPDGQPARRATVTLGVMTGRTDDLGVASFEVVPRPGGKCQGAASERGMVLAVAARDAQGQRGMSRVCAPIASRAAVLVRPARSLVTPGDPVEIELLAASSKKTAGNQVFLDVVKAGQTLATYGGRLQRGRTRVRFSPDSALFGLLELRGYRLSDSGERVGLSRMIYVDHPGELRVSITTDKKVYRPGERARLHFRAVDSRTGDGVQAALGLLGVDEAVVALGGLEPSGSPKVFFTLASQTLASQATGGGGPAVTPGGRELEQWVGHAGPAADRALRARAADVLLAAVRPAAAEVWETNPWQERRGRWEEQAPKLVAAALEYMREHSAGQRTSKGWRFHPDLVAHMVQAGAAKADDRLDPWKRTIRPWHLRQVDPDFVFDRHARRLAPEKLERIYTVLAECWDKLKLGRERMKKLSKNRWPLVLPRTLLWQMVKLGKLQRGEIIDPWGKPYRVALNPRLFVNPYYTGLVSRYLIHSAGPDGRSGTRDDIGPDGPRLAVHLFGRDTALGSDSEDALGGLIGNQIGEAYGVGGLGLVGTGRGGGGAGYGSIGIGRLGTIGRGGGGIGMPARVRSDFPETLLWQPELITDRSGHASLDLSLADSITDWRIVATGSTDTGLLGTASTTLRVFQDFFVDIDLPVALTQGDRISVPVTVYNYLKKPQRVTLRLKREGWFAPAGPLEQTIELQPSQVGVRHFPIVARRVGRMDLTVHASASGGVADAVRRTTLVEPDGVERALSLGGSLRPGASPAHDLVIPEQAIDGTGRVQLAIYAGPMGQTLDGMEGMLRRPSGCFEQTSSTTYPNVLVLDYLKRMKKATPKVERTAKAYINDGYQRLVSFEVAGGGFSWFGSAPANKVLTAYGLLEFFDMARVHPVDPKLIARTQRWLAGKQRADGSWGPDSSGINEGATNNFQNDVLRITAYIAHALRHTGHRGKPLDRALAYVRKHAGQARDAYTLAVLGNLLASDGDVVARKVRERLWRMRRSSDKGLHFAGPSSTLTHGAGDSGKLETTALGALALLSSKAAPAETGRLVDTLVASKDSFGSWYSTQATILSLRALLKQHEVTRDKPRGEVRVLVDGREHQRVRITGERDTSHQLDLTSPAGSGRHRVALRFTGKGNLQYHLAGRYWMPRAGTPAPARSTLAIRTSYDRDRARPGQRIWLDVEVKNRSRQQVEMPLVSLALPPGFAVQEGGLTALVSAGKVDKVQRIGNQAVLYLTKLRAKGSLRFAISLRGKYPLEVQARPSTVYEYYRPENRAESAPRTLKVL